MEGSRLEPNRCGSGAIRAVLWATCLTLVATLLIATDASAAPSVWLALWWHRGTMAPAVAGAKRAQHLRPPAPNANCAHHAVTVVVRHGEEEEKSHHGYTTISYGNGVSWIVTPGSNEIVCGVRVQLQNGSWITPVPDSLPLPALDGPLPPTIGGYYRETNPDMRFHQVLIKFAKSPVPRGSTCNYPLMSTALGGEGKYYQVTWRPSTPMQGQYEFLVTINNPQVTICRAVVELVENYGGPNERVLRSYHPAIGAHGGLSSPLPRPGQNEVLLVWVFGRLAR